MEELLKINSTGGEKDRNFFKDGFNFFENQTIDSLNTESYNFGPYIRFLTDTH